jgi:hypothetical protein
MRHKHPTAKYAKYAKVVLKILFAYFVWFAVNGPGSGWFSSFPLSLDCRSRQDALSAMNKTIFTAGRLERRLS